MATAAHSSPHDEILQETAARLIHVLGLDDAVYACRSNYWHRVLRFVLAYKRSVDQSPRPHGFVRPDGNLGNHSLSQTVTERCRMIPKAASPAIAA